MQTKLPCPRLEFRWSEVNGWTDRLCEYSLVLPLDKYDIRRDLGDGLKQDEYRLLIGSTKCGGGDGSPPIRDGQVDTPYRDHAHAQWDCKALGGHIPIVAVCGDVMSVVPLNPPDRFTNHDAA